QQQASSRSGSNPRLPAYQTERSQTGRVGVTEPRKHPDPGPTVRALGLGVSHTQQQQPPFAT
ncbi:unnamed protein product, partial [Lampetra planeri]